MIPAGAHDEPVAAVPHIEIGDRGADGEHQQRRGGQPPCRRERGEAESRRRAARLRRALSESRGRHPAASTAQSARASRRAPPARRGSPSRSGGAARSVRFDDRIDLVIEKPDEQFLAIAHMHIAPPGQAARSFSKRALDAGFAQLLPEHGQSLIQTGLYRYSTDNPADQQFPGTSARGTP